MKETIKIVAMIVICTFLVSGFIVLVGARHDRQYVSSVYGDYCYIEGNEPKQIRHKVLFESYEDCLLFLEKGIKARVEELYNLID